MLNAAGLADDVGLLTGSMSRLKVLLHLTKIYCDSYQVKQTEVQARFELSVTTISGDGHTITPTFRDTHVGVGMLICRG